MNCVSSEEAIPSSSIGVFGDYAWSTEAHWVERLLRSLAFNSVSWTVCFKRILFKPALYWDVSYPIFMADFALSRVERAPMFFLFDNAWTSYAMVSTGDITVIHSLCISANKDMSRTTHAVSKIFVLSRRAIEFCPLSKSLRSAVFTSQTEARK